MGLVAALEWLGQPYKLSRVDMLGEMRTPPYARLNARVETPVLVTDDRVVTETMAIAAYFEARDTHRKISFDPRSASADRMHQLMGFVNSSFTGAFGPLWTALEATNLADSELVALRRLGRDSVVQRHDQLEAMLDGAPFLVGDHPTLADGVLVGVARWLDIHEVAPRERWPKLSALRARIEATPAVRFALACENGEAPTSAALVAHVPIADLLAARG
jgi:glutathione S-transferase